MPGGIRVKQIKAIFSFFCLWLSHFFRSGFKDRVLHISEKNIWRNFLPVCCWKLLLLHERLWGCVIFSSRSFTISFQTRKMTSIDALNTVNNFSIFCQYFAPNWNLDKIVYYFVLKKYFWHFFSSSKAYLKIISKGQMSKFLLQIFHKFSSQISGYNKMYPWFSFNFNAELNERQNLHRKIVFACVWIGG